MPASAYGEQAIKICARGFECTPNQITAKRNIPVMLPLTCRERTHGIAKTALNLRSDIQAGKGTTVQIYATKERRHQILLWCLLW
jgi:hypothetical protein